MRMPSTTERAQTVDLVVERWGVTWRLPRNIATMSILQAAYGLRGSADPDELASFWAKFMAVVVDWAGVEDSRGEPMPFSRQAAENLLMCNPVFGMNTLSACIDYLLSEIATEAEEQVGESDPTQ